MESVEDRVGKNEAIFRHVNERIAELSASFDSEVLELFCECADGACVERLHVGAADYERARSEEATFIVAPAHVVPSLEEVVFEGDGFVFVRKHGEAAAAAENAV
jgi:hypothetical protein